MDGKAVILVVDDIREQADALIDELGQPGTKFIAAYGADDAIDVIEKSEIDLVVADLRLSGDSNGLDVLDAAKWKSPDTQVVIVTANPTIDSCKQAIRRGAADYLVRPVEMDQLHEVVARTVARVRRRSKEGDFVYEGVQSRSPAMKQVFRILHRVSPTDISVLIQGESGTGKELTARAIHNNSPRRNMAFRPLNCAGLSESLLESELFGHARGAFTGAATDRKGLFEVADKGTLFLDEIGDMPLSMQAKLLRVLEDGVVIPVGSNNPVRVDVRVVSATNHDLAKMVEEKKFRQDLYFRIKGVSVTLPPLRSRPEDIPELFGHFLKQANEDLGRDVHQITEAAMTILVSYSWPGNIRQLRNAVRTMVVMSDGNMIDVNDIPIDIHQVKRLTGPVQAAPQIAAQTAGQSLEEVEKQHIANTLVLTNNNRAEAAKLLKIGERTLYRKIKEYGL